MPEWFIAIILSLIASAPGIYALIANRSKRAAEVTESIVDAAGKLNDQLQEQFGKQIAELQAEIKYIRQDNISLHKRVEGMEKLAKLQSAQINHLERKIAEFRRILQELWVITCDWGDELGREVPHDLGIRVIRALESQDKTATD
jgi:peptidoglycan hydrolase CwlO-like protein